MDQPTQHGGSHPRGLDPVFRSSVARGRHGRMFRWLHPLSPGDAELRVLADSMVDDDGGPGSGDNPDIPSGCTVPGRFTMTDLLRLAGVRAPEAGQ